MKIAIVPVSMMTEQLKLWRAEREVEEATGVLDRRVEGNAKARANLLNRQRDLFDYQTRIETARANIARVLSRHE